MALLRFSLLCITVALALSRNAVSGQDDFGQILLQAFTTGMFPSSNTVGPNPTKTPPVSPEEDLPGVSLEPIASMEASLSTSAQESPEKIPEDTPADFMVESPTPSLEPQMGKEVLPSVQESPEASPGISLEPTAEETLETAILPEGPSFPGKDSNDTSVMFAPVRVNCGSFDERSTLKEDSDKWYNPDSLTAEDPFALAQFNGISEALLYSTYRYAESVLTYAVPLSANGVWRVTLQWAEISPLFMREGARVFKVSINGEERDGDVDVYRDSPLGSFSPLVQSYIVEAQNPLLTIQLNKTVGQPMLSAFQITFINLLSE